MTTDPLEDDPRPDGLRSAPSLVIINTGNGKGKSSAAFGVMLRAVARDWKVGEEKVGRQLGVDWYAFGDGFTWDSENLELDKAHAEQGWAQAARLIADGTQHDAERRRALPLAVAGVDDHERGRRTQPVRPWIVLKRVSGHGFRSIRTRV